MMCAVIYHRGSVLALILVLVLAAGCTRAGELRTERRSVELVEFPTNVDVHVEAMTSSGDINLQLVE
jgi:hypothetical protein